CPRGCAGARVGTNHAARTQPGRNRFRKCTEWWPTVTKALPGAGELRRVRPQWRPGSAAPCASQQDVLVSYPKIELHIHLEGSVRPAAMLQIARRNGLSLPADSVEEMARLYEFRDFPHFLEIWMLTTACLRTEQDFRQVVTDYAAEAASHGAVYLEGIFTPAEPVNR